MRSRAFCRHRRAAAAVAGALAVVFTAGCGSKEPDISVHDATIPVPMNPAVAALYMRVDNAGGDDVLVDVDAARGTASIHRYRVTAEGLSMMEDADRVELPAESTVDFRPGGYHVMIDDPGPLAVGDTVSVTLSFETSDPITVEAQVVESLEGEEHAH